jgi:hypothetical protein
VETDSSRLKSSDFLSAMTLAICDHVEPCCTKVARTAPDDCETLVQAQWQPVVEYAAVHEAQFDAIAASQCIEAYRYAWSRCNDHKLEQYRLNWACLSVFTRLDATSLRNGACNYSMDCLPDDSGPLSCVSTNGGAGTCQPHSMSTLGGICTVSSTEGRIECPDGTLCNNDGICVSRPRLGERCDPSDDDVCEPGSVCDRYGSNVCVSAMPFGTECQRETDCENFSCVNGRCVPSPELPGLSLYCRR